LALALYFAIPANFGLTLPEMRDVAREPARAHDIVGEMLLVRTALSVVAFGAILAAAPVIAPATDVAALLPIAALTIPLRIVSGEWILLAAQRSALVGLARLAGQGAYAVLIVAFITAGQEGAE